MLRNIFLSVIFKIKNLKTISKNFSKVCDKLKRPDLATAFIKAFHIKAILATAKTSFGTQQSPIIFILLDDVNLIKFGRTLGRIKHILKKLLPNICFICTSSLNISIPIFAPHTMELLELASPTLDEVIKQPLSLHSFKTPGSPEKQDLIKILGPTTESGPRSNSTNYVSFRSPMFLSLYP